MSDTPTKIVVDCATGQQQIIELTAALIGRNVLRWHAGARTNAQGQSHQGQGAEQAFTREAELRFNEFHKEVSLG